MHLRICIWNCWSYFS